MLPLRDAAALTGHADDMAEVGSSAGPVPDPTLGWRLEAVRELYPVDRRTPELAQGQSWEVIGCDVVSSAPELARATLNTARVHHDDAAGGRLVYGGHTIGLALSQAVRALPDVVTVLSWQSCDHLGPVREGDTLSSRVEVEEVQAQATGRAVRLRSLVHARSGPDDSPRPVLDWRFRALLQ